MNSLKVVMLMAIMMVLLVAIGRLVGGQQGMIIAFVIAAGMNFFSYWFSDTMVLKMYRAKEVSEKDHPRLYRVVKRVAMKAGLPVTPKVYVVPTRAPNAFATGRNESHAAVAATEGILNLLDEDELEGVIGHEIAHIKNKDMLVGTVAATLAGAIGILAYLAQWGAILGGFSRSNDRGGGAIGLLVAAIVAPFAAALIRAGISRQREFGADARGAEMTGKYAALASALEKLHRAPVQMRLDKHPSTAHLMIANPLSGRGLSALFSTHPPVEDRIARLQELSQQAPYMRHHV